MEHREAQRKGRSSWVSYPHCDEPVRERDAFRDLLERTVRHFPNLETTPSTVIAEGDRAAVEWAYVGTHRRGELFGIRPAGTRIQVKGVTLYRIRGGRVREESGVVDVLGMMAQLGALG